MFQLTTLFLPDSVEDLPNFSVNLDEVALNKRLIGSSIAYVQSFVRSSRFTQRDYFSDNGIGLLTSTVTAAGNILEESSYMPWLQYYLRGMKLRLMTSRRLMMLLLCGTRMREIRLRDGLEWTV